MRDEYRIGSSRQLFEGNDEVGFFDGRNLRFEYRYQCVALVVGEGNHGSVVFHDDFFHHIAIHTYETGLFKFLFQLTYHVYVQLAVHNQYIVAFVFGVLDVAVLFVGVVGIQIDKVAVFVGLIVSHRFFVFFECEILTVHVFQQGKFFAFFVEFLIAEHSVLDKYLEVVPFRFEVGTIISKDFRQAVGHFFGDVSRNLFHVAVALQVAARYVERNVRRVDDTMQ